jgi:hypothetical protein
MNVNVVCQKCGNNIKWTWGKQKQFCSGCKRVIHVRDVKVKDGDRMKLFQ